MSGVRCAGRRRAAGLSAFPELNVRTYVRAARGRACGSSRSTRRIRWRSPSRARGSACRTSARGCRARATATSRVRERAHARRRAGGRLGRALRTARGGVAPRPGTLEHWLTERYCLYARSRRAACCARTSTTRPGRCSRPKRPSSATRWRARTGSSCPRARRTSSSRDGRTSRVASSAPRRKCFGSVRRCTVEQETTSRRWPTRRCPPPSITPPSGRIFPATRRHADRRLPVSSVSTSRPPLLQAAGVVQVGQVPEAGLRPPHVKRSIAFEGLWGSVHPVGVGGLVGLNRGVLLDPLALPVRTGAANSILFPVNDIANDSAPDHQRPQGDLPAGERHVPDRAHGQAGLGHAHPDQRLARGHHRAPRQRRHPRPAAGQPAHRAGPARHLLQVTFVGALQPPSTDTSQTTGPLRP